MKELLEKLAAAPEGSRELDAEIHINLDPQHNTIESCRGCGCAPPYTTSIDAKLPWENIWKVVCYRRAGAGWTAWHVDRETRNHTEGQGHTEAIARRCAALKAREGG